MRVSGGSATRGLQPGPRPGNRSAGWRAGLPGNNTGASGLGKPDTHVHEDDANFFRGYRVPSPFPAPTGKARGSVKIALGKSGGNPFAIVHRSRCQRLEVMCHARDFFVSVVDFAWGDTLDDERCIPTARALGSAAKVTGIDGRVLVMPAGDRQGAASRLRACVELMRECLVDGGRFTSMIRGFFSDSGASPAGLFLDRGSDVLSSILRDAIAVERGALPCPPLPGDRPGKWPGKGTGKGKRTWTGKGTGKVSSKGKRNSRTGV